MGKDRHLMWRAPTGIPRLVYVYAWSMDPEPKADSARSATSSTISFTLKKKDSGQSLVKQTNVGESSGIRGKEADKDYVLSLEERTIQRSAVIKYVSCSEDRCGVDPLCTR